MNRTRAIAAIPAKPLLPAAAVAHEHVVARKPDPGCALGWPANGGLWCWGDDDIGYNRQVEVRQ